MTGHFAVMAKELIAALCLLCCVVTTQDAKPEPSISKGAWLAKHLTPLSDEEALRAALKRLVGTARIVMLGESSHGDGTTFEVKVQLCKMLHEEFGFDVLAFESGIYDGITAGRAILAGADPAVAASKAIFPIWTKSQQVAPLWAYLGQTAKTKRPLVLSGFDMQVTGIAGKNLLDDIETALGPGFEALANNEFVQALASLRQSKMGRIRAASKARREVILAAMPPLRDALLAQDTDDGRLLAQVCASHAEFLSLLWRAFVDRERAAMNLRDAQMARNLQWLMQTCHSDKKVIVWGATSHLIRNRQQIKTTSDAEMIPMGHHLHEASRGLVRTIGFISAEGVTGVSRMGATQHKLGPVPPTGLEHQLLQSGLDRGLLNLRHRVPGDAWLRQPMTTRAMGHADMTAQWNQILDALIWIRKMEPSRLILIDKER